MTARTIGTLLVVIAFFVYLYLANVYVQMAYGNRFGAGSAVPSIQETIQQITETVTQYLQIAIAITIVAIAINMTIKSRRILGVIPFREVQRHLLVLGPTGAGKTTIAKKVIKMAIERSARVTILDWKAGAGPFKYRPQAAESLDEYSYVNC